MLRRLRTTTTTQSRLQNHSRLAHEGCIEERHPFPRMYDRGRSMSSYGMRPTVQRPPNYPPSPHGAHDAPCTSYGERSTHRQRSIHIYDVFLFTRLDATAERQIATATQWTLARGRTHGQSVLLCVACFSRQDFGIE